MSGLVIAADSVADACASIAYATDFPAPVFAYRRHGRLFKITCPRAAIRVPHDMAYPLRAYLQENSKAWAIVSSVPAMALKDQLALAIYRTVERLTYEYDDPTPLLQSITVVVRSNAQLPSALPHTLSVVVDPTAWQLGAARIICNYARRRTLRIPAHAHNLSTL